MKIGIDGIPLCRRKTGIGNYVFYHLKNLIQIRNQDHFFIYVYENTEDVKYFEKFQNVTIRVKKAFKKSDAIWSQLTLGWCCYKDRIDAFWGTTQSIPLLNFHRYKKIITIYDFAFYLYPETVSQVKCIYLKCFSKLFFAKSDRLTVISKGTGEKLENLFGHTNWYLIYPPLKEGLRQYSKNELKSFLKEYQLQYNNYIVTIGTIEPRKNLLELLNFYEKILKKNSISKIRPLVLIGAGGWKNHAVVEKMELLQKAFPHHLRIIGYCSDDQTFQFLSAGAFFVMYSKYEGYGMPIAEARVCNTPVISSENLEMREAAENDAIFINEENALDLLEKAFQKENGDLEKNMIKTSYWKNEDIAKTFASLFDF